MHVLAFAECCEGIEMFLRECTETEITILVAEDKDKMRKHLKDCVALLRSDPAEHPLDHLSLSPADMIKLTHGNADTLLKLKVEAG